MEQKYKDLIQTNEDEKFEGSEKHSFSFMYPSELRKNKSSPVCHPLINCTTPQSRELYRQWMYKEWNVYLSEIQLVRKEMKECLVADKVVDRISFFFFVFLIILKSNKRMWIFG